MPATLCIDFGTGSIRAALNENGRARPSVLELGEAFRSSIDRASIPSAVFIDKDMLSISFGEEALKKGLRGEESFLFEMSPKRWMTSESPATLEKELISGSGLTRKTVLAGLLAQAFSAASTATGHPKSRLIKFDTRVAHPVWDPRVRAKLREHLTWITSTAQQLSGVSDRSITIKEFVLEIKNLPKARSSAQSVDVEEPVAAALELFENSENAREICVVIDVGAGTTDLGVFVSLTPDEQALGHRRKFIQAALPRSIYMAGDLIDEEVLRVIKSRASSLSIEVSQDLMRRRRNIKETLFSRTGKVFEAGVEVTLGDLEKQERIRNFGKTLAINFRDLVHEASGFILPFTNARLHRAGRIDVVFAGGGSKIGFLRDAIGKSAELTDDSSVPIVIRPTVDGGRTMPASIERLAVALGGTTPNRYWPVTELASALEMVTRWDSPGRYVSPPEGDPPSSGWWREQE